MSDKVNHPEHYSPGTYEVIKVVEAWGFDKNTYRANAIKYLSRADKKGTKVQDLEKALWYILRELYHEGGEKFNGSLIDTIRILASMDFQSNPSAESHRKDFVAWAAKDIRQELEQRQAGATG